MLRIFPPEWNAPEERYITLDECRNSLKQLKRGESGLPTKLHHTSEGWYYQWGDHGKKYFFDPDDPSSKSLAKEKADRQGRAAYASGYRGGREKIRNDVHRRQFFNRLVCLTAGIFIGKAVREIRKKLY